MKLPALSNPISIPQFLSGGGEMGQLIREYDWSQTSIGPIGNWSQNLRTTVSNLLFSPFPMLLLWGSDHILFYNDAFRPSLGNNGKHPAALGRKAEEHWTDAWPAAKPLIDKVRNTGEGVHCENLLVPIYRNGEIEDAYWTFGYSPVKDEVGKISGVLVICQETTQNVLAQKQSDANKESFQDIARQKEILASLQVQSLVLQRMDEGVSVSDENGCILFTNPAEDKMFGYEAGELIGRNVIVQNAYPPEENEKIVASVINELKTEGFWSGEWHNNNHRLNNKQ